MRMIIFTLILIRAIFLRDQAVMLMLVRLEKVLEKCDSYLFNMLLGGILN